MIWLSLGRVMVKPYSCHVCGWRFHLLHNMHRHLATHAKEICRLCNAVFSVRDHSKFLGLKPVFRIRIHLIRIRIQHFRLNTDPDSDPIRIRIQSGSRVLTTKNKNKNLQLKQKFNFLWIKNYNLPISLLKDTSKLQKKR